MELFVSINTTGLDSKSDDIIELSYCIQDRGVIVATDTYKIKPRRGKKPSEISEVALKINNVTIEDLRKYEDPETVCYRLASELRQHSKHGKEKFVLVGHNIKFVYEFLDSYFKLYTDYKVWDFIRFGGGYDIMYIVALIESVYGMYFKDYKMESICEVFNVNYIQADTSSKLECLRYIHGKIRSMLVRSAFGDCA